MTTFHGKRARRPALVWCGVLVIVVAAAAVAWVIANQPDKVAERYAPWIGLGGFGVAFALWIASIIPRKASLVLDGDQLRPSWGAPVRATGVAVGRWVMAAIDAPIGAYLTAGGLRIGARDHDGDGYPIAARPVRSIDLELRPDDLDALAAGLGVVRAPGGEFVIELVRSSQSAAGSVRAIAPWLVTMALISLAGVVLALTDLPPVTIGVVTAGGALIGLATTIVLASRIKRPGLAIVLAGDVVAIRRGRDEVARVPWQAVRGAPRRYVVRMKHGTMDLPAIELAVGSEVIAFAAWDPDKELRWPDGTAKGRTPQWIAGVPQWRRLIRELRARRRLAE